MKQKTNNQTKKTLQNTTEEAIQNYVQRLDEKSKKISTNIRSRLNAAAKAVTKKTQGTLVFKANKNVNERPSAANGKSHQITSWKDIFDTLPASCSTAIYLFILNIPEEIRVFLDIDIVSPLKSSLDDKSKNSLLSTVRIYIHSSSLPLSSLPFPFPSPFPPPLVPLTPFPHPLFFLFFDSSPIGCIL